MKVAILVDGGFYRKRAKKLFGEKDAQDRADELETYCRLHLISQKENMELYRIFYYDCPPAETTVLHPLTQKSINLEKTDMYKWATTFFECLKSKRKFALRLGRVSESRYAYRLKPDQERLLLAKKKTVDEITEEDFNFSIVQKGVDVKLGVDVASMALKKQVDRIVLIAGDSDFVPAAKLARREGIDFILDPMQSTIKPDLNEHIDGIRNQIGAYLKKKDKKAAQPDGTKE